MQPALRDLTIAIYELTVEADRPTTNFRGVQNHLGIPFGTTQHRIARAVAEGLIVYEPHLSNTLRLAPNITVHNGQVYRLATL